MRVEIKSKEEIINKFSDSNYFINKSIISFYDKEEKIDFNSYCDYVFYVNVPDIQYDELNKCNLTYDSYLDNIRELSVFIQEANLDKRTIVCQCENGRTLSVGCAAAISQFYSQNGIDYFASFTYNPSKLIYNKVLEGIKCCCNTDKYHDIKNDFFGGLYSDFVELEPVELKPIETHLKTARFRLELYKNKIEYKELMEDDFLFGITERVSGTIIFPTKDQEGLARKIIKKYEKLYSDKYNEFIKDKEIYNIPTDYGPIQYRDKNGQIVYYEGDE